MANENVGLIMVNQKKMPHCNLITVYICHVAIFCVPVHDLYNEICEEIIIL